MFLAMMLIIFGVFFSIVLYSPGLLRIEDWWPAFIVVPGLAMLAVSFVGAASGARGMTAMAIPGCIVSAVGGILLYCNITNHWESWAYVWTLIPASVGLGLLIAGRFGVGDHGSAGAGGWLLVSGVAGFVLLGAFFEVLIFGGMVSRYWPVALIGLGMVLLYRASRWGT
jgi:hypothetical protein